MNTALPVAAQGERHEIVITGSTIRYWVYNKSAKTTILGIHGFRGTHRGLEYIIRNLTDYRIIIPDLPGFGESTPMKQHKHSVESYTRCLELFAQKLKLKNYVVMGHSMGTVVATRLARSEQSANIQSLVLINPIASHPLKGIGLVKIGPGIIYHTLGAKLLPEPIGRKLLNNKLLLLVGSILMTKTSNKPLRKLIHENHTVYMRDYSDNATLFEAYQSSLHSNIATDAPYITTRTLLIAGDIDAIAPAKNCIPLVDVFARAELKILPNVGHIIHYEQPYEAAAAIGDFIASV